VDTVLKSLLIRADFTLDRSRGGDRLTFQRWRRVLADTLPRLLGVAGRCSRAVVHLRQGEEQGRFSAWLRLPIHRRPGRKLLRRVRERLRNRLEAVLLAVGGEVIKLGVRRCQPRSRRAPAEVAPLRVIDSVYWPTLESGSSGQGEAAKVPSSVA
jgi:hypothetical protein